MTAWYTARERGWPAKVVVAAGVLAVLLVAAVPVAFLIGVIMMFLGHVVGGLALFGASVLAAVAGVAGVAIAGVSELRRLRKLVTEQGRRVVQLRRGDYHYE